MNPDSVQPTQPGTAEEQARSTFEQGWRERFEGFAETGQDDAAIAGWTDSGLQARLRNFTRLWQARQPNALWLDAGCGAGTYSRFLAEHGAQPFGMDYSAPTIFKARLRSADVRLWCVGDVTRLPMRDAHFDGALCFGVMQALSSAEPALRELARVVRPGGEIWIDAINRWCLPNLLTQLKRKLSGKSAHLRYDSPYALRHAMRALGLKQVRIEWVPILPTRWQRWQPLLETQFMRGLLRALPPLSLLISHAVVVHAMREELN